MDASQRVHRHNAIRSWSPLDTIECRDAILSPDGGEPDWPEAEAVIGNPPFLGGKLLEPGVLGRNTSHSLFDAYTRGACRQEADLVTYWFAKAGEQIGAGKSHRVGTGRDQLDPRRREPAGARSSRPLTVVPCTTRGRTNRG